MKQFITNSKHPNIARFKERYEALEQTISKETWSQYWQRMINDKIWVDFWFVQATAWYLGLDLWIVDCQSKDDIPFIQISGNIENSEMPCAGPVMTIGTKSNVHYQSLLPTEMLHLEFRGIITDVTSKSENNTQSIMKSSDYYNDNGTQKENQSEKKSNPGQNN